MVDGGKEIKGREGREEKKREKRGRGRGTDENSQK